MKVIFLTIFLQFTIYAAAINISNNICDALDQMQQGYIQNAVEIIKRSAGTNDILAQYYLAQCYEYGIGMSENKVQAFAMYRRAAERGLPAAMKDLSRLYSEGIGVRQSSERANEWTQRYQRKNRGSEIPDLLSIYNQGLLVENSNTTVSNNDVVTSPIKIGTSSASTQSASTPDMGIAHIVMNTLSQPAIDKKSDVDIDIPVNKETDESIFAFIFANENYQDLAKVDNAINDGERVAEYCNKTLGLPETNIHLVKDATLNNMRREINIMRQIADAYNGDASFIVYYAGHGIPDEATRKAYLMPIDAFAGDISTCYSLKDLYNILGAIPSKRNVLLLDACFSGSTRDNNMLVSARGIAIKPKEDKPSGNTLVFASAQGDETSYSYDEQKHGLFTYYLLKKLKESNGNITLGELVDYVKDNVLKKSIVINGKSQTPSVNTSYDIEKQWHDWTLK